MLFCIAHWTPPRDCFGNVGSCITYQFYDEEYFIVNKENDSSDSQFVTLMNSNANKTLLLTTDTEVEICQNEKKII